MTSFYPDQGNFPDTTPCQCDDCGTITPLSDLSPIASAQERLSPGCPVPAGECECGALAYVIEEPKPAPSKVVMTCKHCGGTNVTRDSVSLWDAEAQAWKQCAILDSTDCNDCGGEATLVETPLTDTQAV